MSGAYISTRAFFAVEEGRAEGRKEREAFAVGTTINRAQKKLT